MCYTRAGVARLTDGAADALIPAAVLSAAALPRLPALERVVQVPSPLLRDLQEHLRSALHRLPVCVSVRKIASVKKSWRTVSYVHAQVSVLNTCERPAM